MQYHVKIHWVYPCYLFIFRSGVQALSVRTQVQKLGGNHNSTLRTLGALYSLLVVEEQGAHPESQGLDCRYGCVVQMRGVTGCIPVIIGNIVGIIPSKRAFAHDSFAPPFPGGANELLHHVQ